MENNLKMEGGLGIESGRCQMPVLGLESYDIRMMKNGQ
jgi:hypothetical protein